MTEAEWLNATSPHEMLRFLEGSGAEMDRKLRLFACACCRRVWPLLTDRRSREAVEVAERYAEGTSDWQEMRAAHDNAVQAEYDAQDAAFQASSQNATDSPASLAAAAAAYATGHLGFIGEVAGYAGEAVEETIWAEERAAQAHLLRDIFGSPHHPLRPIGRSLLGWNNGLVRQLAQAAYDERLSPSGRLDPSRLAVLADALLDAGCANAEILDHLRGDGPHWRGCWAVDTLLDKS
jgi:hypothetical protein